MAYDGLEPFGALRDNWHMAVQAQLFCSVHTRKGRRPPDVKDFIYQSPDDRREQNARRFVDFLRSKKV